MFEALTVGVGAGLGAVLRSLLDVSPWAILGITLLSGVGATGFGELACVTFLRLSIGAPPSPVEPECR